MPFHEQIFQPGGNGFQIPDLFGGDPCPQGQIRILGRCLGLDDLPDFPGGTGGGGGGGGGAGSPQRLANVARRRERQALIRSGVRPGQQCEAPLVWNGEFCEFVGSPAGGVGEAVMGRYGPALEPNFVTINVRDCLPGMFLGKDKLCYNKGQITNKERLWPAARRPLLTSGDLAAISKASSAAKRLANKAKQLQGMGMLPKASAPRRKRAIPAHAHAKAIPAVSVG